MKKNLNLPTVAEINSMNYTDFVATVNQWNVPPGSHTTLSKWITFGNITETSNLLEVACTTGFSLREVALRTGCSGTGLDISEKSVIMADYNKNTFAPYANISYVSIDGYEFESTEKYSHIIFGAALRFFPDPEKMLQKSLTFFDKQGLILSNEFYTSKPIPENLIAKAQQIFNITPTQVPYKEVMAVYRGLEMIYEDRQALMQETEDELKHYCESTVTRACEMYQVKDEALWHAMYDRLFSVKHMSNKLRPYQNFNTLVLQYRDHIYPGRYVELF